MIAGSAGSLQCWRAHDCRVGAIRNLHQNAIKPRSISAYHQVLVLRAAGPVQKAF